MIKLFSININKNLFFWGLSFLPFYFLLAFGINFRDSAGSYFLLVFGLFFLYLIYFIFYQFAKKIQWQKNDIGLVFLFALIFTAILILAVPKQSTDFYHYFFEDVVWFHYHQNPYFISPFMLLAEPSGQIAYWQFLPSQHGPVRIFMTLPAMWLSGGNLVLGLFLYKMLFGFYFLLSCFLFYQIILALKIEKPLLVLALFAFNPLVIYETQLNGGTDILLAFWLLLAIYLLIEKKFIFSLTALTLSILVKYVTLILLPFFLIFFLKQERQFKIKALKLFGYLILIFAIIFISFLPFWRGLSTLNGIFWVTKYFETNSFPGLIALLFSFIYPHLTFSFYQLAFILIFLGVYLFILNQWFWSKKNQPAGLVNYSFLVLAIFLLIDKFWFYPKYLIWLLPLIFLAKEKYHSVAVFLTGLMILSPLDPDLIILLALPPVFIFSFFYFIKTNSEQTGIKFIN